MLCSFYFCSILFDQGKLLAQGNSTEQIPFQLWEKESFGYQDPTKEIKAKRDQTTKHFMGQNGQMTAHIASGAIHYWKNGEWQTILHSIEPIQGGFQNIHNSFQTIYPERANGELKTVLPSGQELLEMKEMSMYLSSNGDKQNEKTINASLGNSNFDQIKYADAFGNGIDLILTQRTNGRKMEFVFNNASCVSQFSNNAQFLVFEEKIIIPSGWNAVLINHSIEILNGSGQLMAKYEQPVFYDTPAHSHEADNHENEESHEHRINGNFQISQNGQYLTIKTLVPLTWLKSPERQFPIYIDPTINCTPDNTARWTGAHLITNGSTTWAAGSSAYTSSNIGNNYNDILYLGRANGTDVLNSWAKFNISGLSNTSCVNSVNLYYNVNYNATTQGACRVWTYVRHMNSDPSVAFNAGNNATRLTDVRDGDIYETKNFALMNNNTGWYNTPLSSNLNHLQTNINNGTGWFAVGFHNFEGANNHNTCYLEMRGHSHSNKPYLSVNYTAGYVAQFSNLGPNTFCAGTTQNMSVNVTNIGCKTWTSGGTPPNSVNFSWWGSWQSGQDANPRILPFTGLAPNQSQTITFPITVPTTPGTYNITVDLVQDGVCWFRNNTGSCGPGNVTYSIPITVVAHSTAPTSISGNSTICQGNSTTLTSQGGALATDADDAWYVGSCPNECYTNEFASNPTSTYQTTINSNTNGILNVTATGGDPNISLFNIGNFNASICRYISIRYRVVSGAGGLMEIYYSKNGTQSDLSEAQVVRDNIIANGQWNVLNLDMSTSANWNGTITGWRFDWCTINGSRIEIDFITLSDLPIYAVGPSITVNPSATTTYFTTKKGQCGNTACVSQTITVNPSPTVNVNSETICSGQTQTLTATTSVTGGTYTWSQGDATQSINVTPTATTSYTVTYTIAGCNPVTASGTITVNPSPSVTVNDVTICSGSSTTLSATPGVTGGTYLWSTGETTQDIIVNPSTTTSYSVTYSSGSCTPSSTSATVTISPAPTVSINSITICEGENNSLTATANVSGGTYAWSTGETTASISVNPTVLTSYSVTYSLGACTPATATGTVTVNPAPIVTITPITICEGETGNLVATPDQLGGTYSWSTSETTQSIAVNPTTTTSYSVTYSLGSCTPSISNGTVTVNPAPTVSITPLTICSGETGTLTATPDQVGGTYLWTAGETTATITVNPTTTTTYSVTYSLGACTPAIGNGIVTVNPAPIVTITPITICSGETNTLTVTPDQTGGTYLWSTGATTASISVNPTSNSIYSVTYSLGACTPATATAIVTVNPAPTISINPITICSGETNTLTATPDQLGGSYNWASGETTASISVNPTVSTTYSVTYSLGACTLATATVTVTVTPSPTISISDITICSGGSGILTATPTISGGIYTWSTGQVTSSITVNPINNSNYSVTYTLGSCTQANATATVTVSPAPIVTVASITICSGETGTLIATPNQLGGTYQWSTGGTNASISVNPTTTSNYSITYSLGACTPSIANVTVTVNPAPTVAVNSITICSGASGTLTATPTQLGGTYLWSTGATTATITESPTLTGTYSVTYSLGACSLANGTGTITVNPTPTVTINSPTICSGNSSSLTATPSIIGGTYVWSTAAVTQSIAVNPVVTTNYTVTYTLSNCSASATTSITVNPTPTVTVNSSTICNGQTTIITAAPSLPGGTYLWSNSQTTNAISLSPTVTSTFNVLYSLTGCNATATATVTVNPIPQVTVASTTICNGEIANLTASPNLSGGTYEWSQGGLTSQTISVNPNSTTNYSIVYTLNNCASPSASATVVVNPVPMLTINSGFICTGQSFTLNATPSIPGGTFNWITTGETTSSITVSPLATTSYSASYTTLEGCTSTISTGTVTISETPNVSFTASVIEGCAPLRVTFYNTTQASSDLSNCVWSINSNSQLYGCDSATYVFNQAGCFDVSLSTSANGCIGSNSQSAYICVENPPIASFQANPMVFTDINQTINFVNTSTGAVSYEWNFGDNSTSQLSGPMHYFEGTENGYTVSLIVTSSFGCTSEYILPITYKEPEVYYIPNTFTPDADEHNQVFLPIFTSGIDFNNYLFQIYNRWGEIVFQSSNHLEGWDGSYGLDGRDVQQGTYVYRISFRSLNSAGIKTISGHVNLIR